MLGHEQRTWFEAPGGKAHSAKPETFFHIVETITPAPRYAFLFAGGSVPENWDGHGDRNGHHSAPDHPGQAILRRGEAYKGPAMLFGRRFYTAYHPVFDPAGKVIGIIYVGTGMDELDGMLWQAIYAMAIAAGIAALFTPLR